MNFKEEYRSTFSEIHASETLRRNIMEATEMEINKKRFAKNKKIIISVLVAAALAAGSAVAVSAGAWHQAVEKIRLFINGQEVSASDYINKDGIELVGEDGEFQIELNDLPEDPTGIEITLQTESGKDSHTASVTVTQDS